MHGSEIPGVIKLPDSIDNALKNLTDEPSKGIGGTLNDLWQLKIGIPVREKRIKRDIEFAYNIIEYGEEVQNQYAQIPENRRVEPTLLITEQALAKSQTCLEEKELRSMFAKVVARSMDSEYTGRIHPSFSEIIPQLSPIEAKLISDMGGFYPQLPLAKFNTITGGNPVKGKMYRAHLSHVVCFISLENPESNVDCYLPEAEINEYAIAFNSLNRLGLVEIDYDHCVVNFDYERHYSAIAKSLGLKAPKLTSSITSLGALNGTTEIVPGIARMSHFGERFFDVCIK